MQEGGKSRYERLVTTVRSLNVSRGRVQEAKSGGLVGSRYRPRPVSYAIKTASSEAWLEKLKHYHPHWEVLR